MAKGKKEDPNKVAQRKAQRVAFVQSRPDLAPEVARKRFYVQTRAQELEAAGKPVDRAALRQKFETGGVTREGFYTPADIARINARKNVNNGTGSLADTKTTTTVTPSTPVKNPPVGGVVGAPTTPPKTTTTPTKSKPQSRPPDRIVQDKVVVAGVTQKSPDVEEARIRVFKTQPTPAQIQEANVYTNLVKKYKGNEKLAQAAYQLTVGGGEKVTPIESALFGKGVSAKTFIKEQSGIPQIGRGIEEVKTGKGITGKLRGIKDVALGGFQLAGNIAMLKGGANRLSNTRFFKEVPAISQRFELPAAGQTGKFGAASRAEEARITKIQAEREAAGWGAGAKPPVEAGPGPMTRAQVAEQRRLQRQAAVKQAEAPSLAEVKQAEIDAKIEAGIKAATEKPVAEAPAVEIKTQTKGKGKGKNKSTVEPAPTETTATKTTITKADIEGPKGGRKVKKKVADKIKQETAPAPEEMTYGEKLAEGWQADDFEFDASTMEMGSTERAMGDAYLYDPKADLGNLADVKAETKINYADIKAKTETPAVEVKGKSKGGKGKSKSTVEPKPAETVATKPEAKPVKKKTTVELATQPRGRQSIAPSIELKQGTKPGQVMGQAEARMKPVAGEIETLPSGPKSKQQVRSITQTVGSGTKADPFRSQTRQFVVEGTGAKGDPFKIVAEVKQGQSQLETFIPREAPTGKPRSIPEPPPEKVAQPKKPPARSRGKVEVKQYTPPPGNPVRISRAEAQQAVRIRERVAKELRDNPFEAGVPKGEPKSALGRLEGETVQQIRSKGGRPAKVTEGVPEFDLSGMAPRERAALSSQADIEMAKRANVDTSLVRGERQLNRISRWLSKNMEQGTLSSKGEALRDLIDKEIVGIRFQRADAFRTSPDQLTYFEMVTNPRKNTRTRSTGLEAPRGGLMSDRNLGRGRVPTAEGFEKAQKRLFPLIDRLEKKTTLTQNQVRELESAYKSLYNASPTDFGKAEWQAKTDLLAEKIKNKQIEIIVGRAKGKK